MESTTQKQVHFSNLYETQKKKPMRVNSNKIIPKLFEKSLRENCLAVKIIKIWNKLSDTVIKEGRKIPKGHSNS